MKDVKNLNNDIVVAFREKGITPTTGRFGRLVVRDGKFDLNTDDFGRDRCGCAISALVVGAPAPSNLGEVSDHVVRHDFSPYVCKVIDAAVDVIREDYGLTNYEVRSIYVGFDGRAPDANDDAYTAGYEAAVELGLK